MMRRRKQGARATTILAILLLASSLAPVVGPSPIGERDPYVVDQVLHSMMLAMPHDTALDVIVQFRGPVTSTDLQVLRAEGIELVHEFHIVDGVWARATPAQLERLSGYARTRWMEYNERLVFCMDETTTVVNATKAWYSRIEGSLWGATGGIDGTGVTAVVLDTGIDAGHPDLDYGRKTIMNLKSDTGVGPWFEIENGDTSSGHGTHCAGTVAGNGDASNGARRGMAPGANLIGLSTGDAGAIINALGGLEWVYDHSRPGNNPHNIRVVSNSWGAGGGQYSPDDSISAAINRLVYENNVAVVFAAGNSAGTGDDIQSSNYGNTPSAICIAAAGRDGKYITDFSSKGQWNWLDTWPDIAAPGHHIESTAARRTQISLMTRDPNANPYYLAISGTSMATPHVSGLCALLWQACPSMRVSDVRQDAGLVENVDGTYTIVEPEGDTYGALAYPVTAWYNEALDTRIHETELILKLTADMIPPTGEPVEGMNGQTGSNVTDWSLPGVAADRPHDYCQGYGLINAARAVGLALTLERIRWDYPEATVLDAYSVYKGIFGRAEYSMPTDQVEASWGGEWTRFNNQVAFNQNLTKYVYVPKGADTMTVSMSYSPVNTLDRTLASLWFRLDTNSDGSWDHTSPTTPSFTGVREETIPVSEGQGGYWMFGVGGNVIKLPGPADYGQYKEARVEYEMSVSIHFPSASGAIVIDEKDLHAINGHLRFSEPSSEYAGGNVTIVMDVYNINNVSWSPNPPAPPIPEHRGFPWLLLLGALIALLVLALVIARTMPESRAGRVVRRALAVTGAAAVIAALLRSVHRLRLPRRKGSGTNGSP